MDIMWAPAHQKICEYLDGGCSGSLFNNRWENIPEVMHQTHSGFCNRVKQTYFDGLPLPAKDLQTPEPFCDGACTVIIKIHQEMVWNHGLESLAELLGKSGVKAIVSEREDVAAQECSYEYSKATGIWHSGSLFGKDSDPKKKEWEKEHCKKEATKNFVTSNLNWYEWVRATLKDKGTPTLEMSVEQYAADPAKGDADIHRFAYGRAAPTHPDDNEALTSLWAASGDF